MAHQGEALQEAIKQSGFPISRLVQELGITRPTIYRKFREETLDESFVKRVHDIVGRNVTLDTPIVAYTADTFPLPLVTGAALQSLSTVEDYAKALISLQQKHIKLLEDYNALLTKMYTGR
jgi:Bacterial regulatory protein, Fis family